MNLNVKAKVKVNKLKLKHVTVLIYPGLNQFKDKYIYFPNPPK